MQSWNAGSAASAENCSIECSSSTPDIYAASSPSTKTTSTPTDHTERLPKPPPLRALPQPDITETKIIRRDRLGGVIQEYTQVA